MKSEIHTDVAGIKKLEDLSEQKNILLKSYVVLYTNAMEQMDLEDMDAFSEKIEQCAKIQDSVDRIEKQISSIASGFNPNSEIVAVLHGDMEASACSSVCSKLADNVSASRKLLKNCQTLNEMLTYRAKSTENELQKEMAAIKNRKMIKQGYDSYKPAKAGMVIDC